MSSLQFQHVFFLYEKDKFRVDLILWFLALQDSGNRIIVIFLYLRLHLSQLVKEMKTNVFLSLADE